MDELEKLRILLPHWVDHSAEHANEFRTWAKRAREADQDPVAARIEAAAQKDGSRQQGLERCDRALR